MRRRREYVVVAGLLLACGAPDAEENPADEATAVKIHADVIYGHKFGMALTLDVYRPARANGAGVVFLNSGGSVSPVVTFHTEEEGRLRLLSDAEVEFADYAPGRLLQQGFTLFNVRHGSVPKFVLPEIAVDARRAIRFVRDRAPNFGVDPNRLGLWGGSAGGHLALLLGTTPDVSPPDVEDRGADGGATVAAVVAFFPTTDLDTWIPHVDRWAREIVKLDLLTVLPALDFDSDQNRELSPVHHASSDDPPTLIIHGDQDQLVPLAQSERMDNALREVGVTSELVVIEGAGHGFFDDHAEFALAQTLTWFQRHLAGAQK